MKCDRCNEPALLAWWRAETKGELYSCIRHGREWAPILHEQGWIRVEWVSK